MGLPTTTKKAIKDRFPAAFGYESPTRVPVLCVDMMQFFKGSIPSFIITHEHLYTHYINLFLNLLNTSDVVVACVDKSSPEVKGIITHGDRYERRCAECKKFAPEMPAGMTCGAEYFAVNCKKDCMSKQILHSSEGPHLLEDSALPLTFDSKDWMRFASDSVNLRHELYPRIVNRLLSLTLPVGKVLYLNGFPFKLREAKQWLPEYQNGVQVESEKGMLQKRIIPDHWLMDDIPIQQDSYDNGHTIRIERDQKVVFPEAYNKIHEADHVIFYFLSFFPQYYQHMVFINDGDAISIGLTLAQEYLVAPEVCSHELWLCLPTKRTDGGPKYEYVNLTHLCNLIKNAPEFLRAGVQSPVMTYVFLITLTGTDFFKKIYNIGDKTDWSLDEEERAKQVPGIWDTFMDKMNMFSHLVQFYTGDHSVKQGKRVILDEELFLIFLQYCFMGKYGKSAKKKQKKDDVTFDLIKIYCSKLKDEKKRLPSDDVMLRMCRQLDWNLNYILNGWRNNYIDPYEEYEGKSYYGYTREPVPRVVDVVCSRQKEVDETCKRHFWKKKRKQENRLDIPEKRKRSALEKIKGF